jgi:hypothetical protein
MNAYDRRGVVMEISNRPDPAAAALPPSGEAHRSCCREILRLTSENGRLTEELARAQARQEDLARSAEIWINLYETCLDLANRSAVQKAATSPEQTRQ